MNIFQDALKKSKIEKEKLSKHTEEHDNNISLFRKVKKRIVKSKNTLIKKKELKKNTHLIIFDMRFITYNEIESILKRLDPSNKVYIINQVMRLPKGSKKYPEKLERDEEEDVQKAYFRENKIKELSKKYNIEYVIVKKAENYINSLISTYKNYKLITIVNNVLLRKNKLIKNNQNKATKQKEEKEILPYRGAIKRDSKSNIVLWDIENISYKQIDRIMSKLDYLDEFYIVSVRELAEKELDALEHYIEKYDFRILTGHEDSDEKINEIVLDRYNEFEKVTIISSDTDFIPVIETVLDSNKKVKIISRDIQKKGMIMNLQLSHKKLTFMTI